MGSIRNASGRLDYICTDGNNASTDGRFDRINTGANDNGVAFSGYAVPAPVIASAFMSLSPQRCEVTHLTISGTAATLYFANNQTPSFNTDSDYARALPVNAAKTRYQKQVVPIAQGQRGKTDMFWAQWKAGNNSDSTTRLYRIVLQYGEVETA
jgi:secreted PhoX family phosphatase